MNRLKELRQKKGDTQAVVAEAMGVTRRGYQKWENGESQIKPEKAEQLAKYFRVNVGYLLGYEKDPIKSLEDFIRESDDPYSSMRQDILQIFEYIDPKEKELLYNIVKVFQAQKETQDDN